MIHLIINFLYGVAMAPFFVPLMVYRWNKNRYWRKTVQVGDVCFYTNLAGGKTFGKIGAIHLDRSKVRIDRETGGGISSGWHDLNSLSVL